MDGAFVDEGVTHFLGRHAEDVTALGGCALAIFGDVRPVVGAFLVIGVDQADRFGPVLAQLHHGRRFLADGVEDVGVAVGTGLEPCGVGYDHHFLHTVFDLGLTEATEGEQGSEEGGTQDGFGLHRFLSCWFNWF